MKNSSLFHFPFTILFSSSWFFSFSHFLLKSSRRDTNFGLGSKERNITMEYRYLIFSLPLPFFGSTNRKSQIAILSLTCSLGANATKAKADNLWQMSFPEAPLPNQEWTNKTFFQIVVTLPNIMSSRSSFSIEIQIGDPVESPVTLTDSLVTLLDVCHKILRA